MCEKNIKVNAAILIIGNEILSGRTQDTNTSTLATWLNSIGVKVGEVRVIPDVEKTIVDTVTLLKKIITMFSLQAESVLLMMILQLSLYQKLLVLIMKFIKRLLKFLKLIISQANSMKEDKK